MAIIVNGKLTGRLGNLVYRTVNGKTVVQSYPRPPKGGYKLTETHAEFAIATRTASRLYRQLKDFALNLTMRDLFNSMNGLFIREIKYLQPENGQEDWVLIPGSLDLRVGKRAWMDDLLEDEVVMRVADGQCRFKIPPLKLQGGRFSQYKMWKEVGEMELACTLLHYDFETESAMVVERWVSGRFSKKNMPGEVVLDYDLVDAMGREIDGGLLLGSVGLRLHASEISDSYLNHYDFNPFSVVGIWTKA